MFELLSLMGLAQVFQETDFIILENDFMLNLLLARSQTKF